MTEEEFRQHVVPAILPLFSVTDRSVRIQLLEKIDTLIQHMDNQTINDSLFESINQGFSDVAKPIRELTLKSMLSLANKLNEKNLNDRLMRSLAKMQVTLSSFSHPLSMLPLFHSTISLSLSLACHPRYMFNNPLPLISCFDTSQGGY